MSRTVDLGYFEGEKHCSICQHNGHYTRDCPDYNSPPKTWQVKSKNKSFETLTVQGRARYEAWVKACNEIHNLDEEWYDENWHTIEVVLK